MAKSILNLPGEIWKPVVGWEKCYLVSNRGRLISLARDRSNGNGRYQTPTKLLTPSANSQGYLCIRLCNGGIQVRAKMHILVLEAFKGPRPCGLDACHGNDIKSDNRVDNLRWDTRSANLNDAMRNGLLNPPRGSANHHAALTESDVAAIRKSLGDGKSGASIARAYGVSENCISSIKLRKGWKHVKAVRAK